MHEASGRPTGRPTVTFKQTPSRKIRYVRNMYRNTSFRGLQGLFGPQHHSFDIRGGGQSMGHIVFSLRVAQLTTEVPGTHQADVAICTVY